jgi:catechol 2,3-dioxygenase-like lactoylglutathione lyase family enzyme
MSILDHCTLMVSDYERSKAFYTLALAPLGITPVREYGKACGFGRTAPSGVGKPDFWIGEGPTSFQTSDQIRVITPTHIAFVARSRDEVAAFHAAAIAAGGKDFGAPGLRPVYHAHYYGSFVLDPDGHDVEAVYHEPE